MTNSEDLLQLIATAAPPELGPGPREEVMSLIKLDGRLDPVLEKSSLPRLAQQLLRATVYLWHDHLDAAHSIAQGIENRDGSYVHGIMHRREPDYGNAAYWFHRVGEHPCFTELRKRAVDLLSSAPTLREKLIGAGEWDAFAFIKECENAARNPSQAQVLREIQAAELKILLAYFSK